MSFAKIKSQTLPDMINTFTKQFNDYKCAFENNQSSNQKLFYNIQNFDLQVKRMESKLNDIPDNKKMECINLFQNVLSEYLEFKAKYKNEIEKCCNEQNTSINNSQENNDQQLLVEQSMEEQEAQNLEYIARESEKIIRQMRELNEISNQVNHEINSQRIKIVSIESLTDTAVKKMEKGNKELEKAEKNQRTCNIF